MRKKEVPQKLVQRQIAFIFNYKITALAFDVDLDFLTKSAFWKFFQLIDDPIGKKRIGRVSSNDLGAETTNLLFARRRLAFKDAVLNDASVDYVRIVDRNEGNDASFKAFAVDAYCSRNRDALVKVVFAPAKEQTETKKQRNLYKVDSFHRSPRSYETPNAPLLSSIIDGRLFCGTFA